MKIYKSRSSPKEQSSITNKSSLDQADFRKVDQPAGKNYEAINFTFFPGVSQASQDESKPKTDYLPSSFVDPKNTSQPGRRMDKVSDQGNYNHNYTKGTNFDPAQSMTYQPRVEMAYKEPFLKPTSAGRPSQPQAEIGEEKPRPSRFAQCLGYDEADPLEFPSRRQADEASAITEEVDMYEAIREQPYQLDVVPEQKAGPAKHERSSLPKMPDAKQSFPEYKQQRGSAQALVRSSVDQPAVNLQQAEDTMFNMLYQQARILENKLESKKTAED